MKQMGAITTTRMSFAEFELLPDQPGKRELLEGELIELPPAEFKHNAISERIYDRMKAASEAARASGQAAEVGAVHHEMGYALAGDGWLQPDVSVTHAGQAVGRYLEGAPAIAIEVVSPGNSAVEMETKLDLYFRHGAKEVWWVYDKPRRIVVHLGGTSRTFTEGEAVTTPLLPGLSLGVGEILG